MSFDYILHYIGLDIMIVNDNHLNSLINAFEILGIEYILESGS